DQLARVDPRSGAVLKTIPFAEGINQVGASPAAVWVASRRRALVTRVDTASGATRDIPVGTGAPRDVVYGAGAIWIAGERDDSVFRMDPRTGDVITIGVGRHPDRIAVRGKRVYVTNYSSSTLSVIDARTNRVLGEPVVVPVNPYAIAATPGAVWVTSVAENKVAKLTGRGA